MFRFTIREVLWLMVVVALAVGWWIDRSQLDLRNRRNEEKIAILTNWVKDSYELLDSFAPNWRELNRHFVP